MQMLGGKPSGAGAPAKSAEQAGPAPAGDFDDDIPF
jgi:hypothetical protein